MIGAPLAGISADIYELRLYRLCGDDPLTLVKLSLRRKAPRPQPAKNWSSMGEILVKALKDRSYTMIFLAP